MGKHRFRLSDMMPNAWFYKLKDMSKPHHPPLPNPSKLLKTQKQPPPPPPLIPNRASYYFPSSSPSHPKAIDTTHFPPDSRSPRKSSSTTRPRRIKVLPTPRSTTTTTTSPRLLLSISSTSTCSRASLSESDSDLHHNSYCTNSNNDTTTTAPPKLDVLLDLVGSELDLRPILTKPPAANKPKKQEDMTTLKRPTTPKNTTSTSAVQPPRLRSSSSSSTRRTSSSSSAVSPGRKVRVAARRPLGGRRSRRGIEESFAVVKSSSDPRRDFRESMMEMILENRLTASKDLEDLLACYLSLNSNQYHDVIVKVFQEIWLDITNFVNK